MCDPELITKLTTAAGGQGAPGSPAAGRSTVRQAQPGPTKAQKDAAIMGGTDPIAIYEVLRDRILASGNAPDMSDSALGQKAFGGLGIVTGGLAAKAGRQIAAYNANQPLQASRSPYGAGGKPRAGGAGGFSAGASGGGGAGAVPGSMLGGATLLGA